MCRISSTSAEAREARLFEPMQRSRIKSNFEIFAHKRKFIHIDGCFFFPFEQDHYFDVVTNIVGLVAAVLGDKFYWWIDPAGAIALAVYTISNWSGTVLETAGYSLSLTYTHVKGANFRNDRITEPLCEKYYSKLTRIENRV